MIENKIIFVTGGAGFIGTNIVSRLVKNNTVIVYDNMSRPAIRNLNVSEHENLTIIQGDILNFQKLKNSIPDNVDIILHLAAIAGVDNVMKNPIKTMQVNIIGTYYLLKSLEEKGLINRIKRFVFFSTSEVFGTTAFKSTEDTPTTLQPVGEARWTYSVSKVAGEHMVNAYYKKSGLKSVIIRPFNVYGPGQIGEGAIHNFVVRAIKNEPLQIHGDGSQIRAWCYIDDMVEAVFLSLETEKAIGEVFNIGNPRSTTTIFLLAEKIIQLANSSSSLEFVPKNYADVELRIPSIEKAKRILGYKPKIDLNEGLKRTIEWYRERLKCSSEAG